jgi:hypothetical protein
VNTPSTKGSPNKSNVGQNALLLVAKQMRQESRTKVTVRTLTIQYPSLKGEVTLSLISELWLPVEIEVLVEIVTEALKAKLPNVKVEGRNDES